MEKKILVVDDEESVRKSVQMLLENEGYAVVTAAGGKECLQWLVKQKFDLVLLDVLMPEMTGNEVAEKIRANPKTKNQKIAFLTILTLGPEGRAAMKKIKPKDYIQKPFKNADFKKRIKKIVGSE
jgi:two-component system, sensor histidine kinase and response regulator